MENGIPASPPLCHRLRTPGAPPSPSGLGFPFQAMNGLGQLFHLWGPEAGPRAGLGFGALSPQGILKSCIPQMIVWDPSPELELVNI